MGWPLTTRFAVDRTGTPKLAVTNAPSTNLGFTSRASSVASWRGSGTGKQGEGRRVVVVRQSDALLGARKADVDSNATEEQQAYSAIRDIHMLQHACASRECVYSHAQR